MITIRPAASRGRTSLGWLESRHSFSFADYYDPEHMGFSVLRVINDDRVQGGQGFGLHPHRDMEILTYVVEGTLEHKDSMGNGSLIHAGEVQRMSAGTGILHSEYNPSPTEPVHLLQIWILPSERGIAPSYEQRCFTEQERQGKLRLVASPDGSDGSVRLHQRARVFAGLLARDERAELRLSPGRNAWVQVARGLVLLNGTELGAGDGARLTNEVALELEGRERAEVLVFDLP
jgi:hypothetical protein